MANSKQRINLETIRKNRDTILFFDYEEKLKLGNMNYEEKIVFIIDDFLLR